MRASAQSKVSKSASSYSQIAKRKPNNLVALDPDVLPTADDHSKKPKPFILESNRTPAPVFKSDKLKAATKRGFDDAPATVNRGTLERSVPLGSLTTRPSSPRPSPKMP